MALPPSFYNVGDQPIYTGGQHFIPQEQYRLGYYPPGVVGDNAEQGITTSGTGVGIPYTNAFTGSGGNFDTNIRTPKNYRRTEGSYVPGSIGLPGNVPQSGPGRDWSTEYEFTRPLDTDLINKYREYNPGKYEKYTDRQMYDIGLKGLDANNLSYTSTNPMAPPEDDEGDGWRGGLTKALQWGSAAAGIPLGWISKVGGAINQMLPTNRRAIMENEMLGSGFALDDIGRIVATGDYNTPEGIMAGYNAYQMDEDTFDDRIKKIKGATWKDKVKQRQRIKLIEQAKQQWLDSQGTTDAIIDKKEMDKKMKAYSGPETSDYDSTIQTTGPTYGPHQGSGDKGQHTTQGKSDAGYAKSGGSGMHGGKHYAQGGRIYLNLGGLARLL